MDNVKVYVLNITGADYNTLFNRYINVIEPKRRERIENISNEGEKLKLLLSGILLWSVMYKLNVDLRDIEYGVKEKPYIKGNRSIFYNLSHSGDYVVLAVNNNPVGIDIQEQKKVKEAVFNKVSDANDLLCRDLYEKGRFDLIWSVKEAYSKLTGQGITMDLKRISLALRDDEVKIYYDGRLKAGGRVLTIDDKYSLSVCSEEGFDKFEIVNVPVNSL